jgi:hypothetical protein
LIVNKNIKNEIRKKFKEHRQLVPSIKLNPLIKTIKKNVQTKILVKSLSIKSLIKVILVSIMISSLIKNNAEKNKN